MADVISTKAIPMSGKNVWYFLQKVDAPVGSPAGLPAWQTEGSLTMSGDMIDEQTKFGRILKKGTIEQSIEITQYYTPADETAEWVMTEQPKGEQIKVWRVLVDEAAANGKDTDEKTLYKALFGFATISDIDISDGDELIELQYTLEIISELKPGLFPLSDDEVSDLEELYKYQNPGDTTGAIGTV